MADQLQQYHHYSGIPRGGSSSSDRMYRSARGHGSNLLECEILISSHRTVKLMHALAR